MTPVDDLPPLPEQDDVTPLAARAERDKQWSEWGVIEVAVRNHSVAEYMRHWEGRAEAAEARVKKLEPVASESADWMLAAKEAQAERDALQARVKDFQEALDTAQRCIVEAETERDTIRTRVAKLEEKLMVMCVGQLKNAEDTAWMIECRNGFTGWWDGRVHEGMLDCRFFNKDPNACIRFSRKEDAERVIAKNGHSCQIATDHAWSDPRKPLVPSPDPPAPVTSIDHHGEDES